MKDTEKLEMNEKVKQAYENAVPEIRDAVLADCRGQGELKGQYGQYGKRGMMLMQENRKPSRWKKYTAAAAACLVLLLGGTFGLRVYHVNYAVASAVSLDVNPSIRITVNEKERVLDVEALNEDGRTVIGDMDFSGSDIDVAVNALIGSMLRNGYLSDIANSILISVEDAGSAKSAALQEKLTETVNDLFQADGFSGAVLSQVVSKDSGLEQLAQQYGITAGKAQLIQEILKNGSRHTFEELAPLTINELNLLAETGTVSLDNISSVGSASEKSYIGADAAKAAALAHAGVSEADITGYTSELDMEKSVMVYEIDFKAGGYEYEYDINALTGEIVKYEREKDDDYRASDAGSQGNGTESGQASQNNGQSSGQSSAQENAQASSGNQHDNEHSSQSQHDNEHSSQSHHDNGQSSQNPSDNGNASAQISIDDAKQIALKHAGLSEESVVFKKAKSDYEDGLQVYEIEFVYDRAEYEYEIDAASGNILSYDCDTEDFFDD